MTDVEGYMYCHKLIAKNIEIRISNLISKLKTNHPEFKFNVCLASESTLSGDILIVDNIPVIPYNLPAYHYWFISHTDQWIEE